MGDSETELTKPAGLIGTIIRYVLLVLCASLIIYFSWTLTISPLIIIPLFLVWILTLTIVLLLGTMIRRTGVRHSWLRRLARVIVYIMISVLITMIWFGTMTALLVNQQEESARAILEPIIVKIDEFKNQNGRIPELQEIGNESRSIKLQQNENHYLLWVSLPSYDQDGYSLGFNSKTQQWSYFHNDDRDKAAQFFGPHE